MRRSNIHKWNKYTSPTIQTHTLPKHKVAAASINKNKKKPECEKWRQRRSRRTKRNISTLKQGLDQTISRAGPIRKTFYVFQAFLLWHLLSIIKCLDNITSTAVCISFQLQEIRDSGPRPSHLIILFCFSEILNFSLLKSDVKNSKHNECHVFEDEITFIIKYIIKEKN